MKTIITFIVCCLSACLVFSQPYQVGHVTITVTDASRSNRAISTEIYFPTTNGGTSVAGTAGTQFPVIAFGHGFSMNYDAYTYLWNDLVPRGYILAFPTTEVGPIPFPSHTDFGKDLAYLLTWFKARNLDATSIFNGKIAPKCAIGGHSMGGGCSYLAAANNPDVSALFNFAAAETNPSAIAAAPNVTAPALVLAASADCVAPNNTNQVPMYNGLVSTCKTYANITSGSHCQFGDYNFLCSFGESASCASATYISRADQHTYILQLLEPWLDFWLKRQCNQYFAFENVLTTLSTITYQQTCNVTAPAATVTANTSTTLCANQTVQLLGGAAGLIYQWNTGDTTKNITVSQGGLYKLVVTNSFNCQDSDSISVTTPTTPFSLQTGSQSVSCSANGDGIMWVVPTGGYGSYTYHWSVNPTTDTIRNVGGGIYYVTVTDANQCSQHDSVLVSQPIQLTAQVSPANVLCHGDSTGKAIATVNGGTSPYLYNWSMGTGNDTLLGLAKGNYTLTVKDHNNCTATANFSISEPATALQLSTGKDNPRCNGDSNGRAWAHATGGTPLYTYAWTSGLGGNADTIIQLASGNYQVTATDVNGCSAIATVQLIAPTAFTVKLSADSATCPGANNGAAQALATGGAAPYVFLWRNGTATYGGDSINNILSGLYTCMVTDTNACMVLDSIIVPTTNLPNVTITSPTGQSICAGDTANLGLTTGFAHYNWNTGDTTATLVTGLQGSYAVTVTNQQGCNVYSDTFKLFITTSYLQPQLSVRNDTLFSSIVPVTQWTKSGQILAGNTQPFIYPIDTGTYLVTVTDTNGCKASKDTTFLPTGLYNIGAVANDIMIYPNPTDNLLYLNCKVAPDKVILVDVLGHVMLQLPIPTNASPNWQATLNLSELSAGTYFLITEKQGLTYHHKVVKN